MLRASPLLIALVVVPMPAVAKDDGQWVPSPGITSAYLANEQSRLISSSSSAWPDGRQVVVTFWREFPNTFRCFDYFDDAMTQVGAACWYSNSPRSDRGSDR